MTNKKQSQENKMSVIGRLKNKWKHVDDGLMAATCGMILMVAVVVGFYFDIK